ncbi:MAG: 4Fe-4S binding protein [Desulfobacterales bacterium]
MKVKQVKLIYFSPTGTTQKVLESIAKGITVEDVEYINLTPPEGAQQTIPPFSDELVIMGAPVYGGRLPVVAINRFKQLKAGNTLAILIVVYGNREFEDALLELKKLAIELGFNPIAGGAFIGAGRFPYEGGARSMTVSPVTKEDTCTVCGTCAGVCPTAAISINGSVATKIELCIRCSACIKNCPTGARVWEDSTMKNIANWLNENCSTRKEPQIFGIDV